jgi:hypothetical protein
VHVFRGLGAGKFQEIKSPALGTGSYGTVTAGDIDEDGDIDIAYTGSEGAFNLVRNDHDNGDFLTVRLVGSGRSTDGIGGRISVFDAGYLGDPLHLRGYHEVTASSSDHRPYPQHFGLPCAKTYDVRVQWPGGAVTDQATVPTGQAVTIRQK